MTTPETLDAQYSPADDQSQATTSEQSFSLRVPAGSETRIIAGGKDKFSAKRVGGFTTVNPDKLSPKQKGVVVRFGRKYGATFNELAPYLNLIFAIYNGDLTLERFQKLTGIELSHADTFSDYSEHNL